MGHCLWWVDEDRGPVLVLTSVEGTSDQVWPISPPFQEIVCEPVGAGGKQVLLGVGRAGKSHWSATIEGDSMIEAIAFDIACRSSSAPEWLGSTYRIHPAWLVEETDESVIRLRFTERPVQLHLQTLGQVKLSYSDDQLAIEAAFDPANSPRGTTHRWRYILSHVEEENRLAAYSKSCLKWFAKSASAGGGTIRCNS